MASPGECPEDQEGTAVKPGRSWGKRSSWAAQPGPGMDLRTPVTCFLRLSLLIQGNSRGLLPQL